jgi:sterol desaturase/sphingolipid hydroxylase (fatty acid hydroxylase superfamily)
MALLVIETVYGWAVKNQTLRSFDTISSLSSGITNIVKDILGLTLVIVSYDWMEERISLFHIEDTIWVYVISFVAIDFAGYVKHYMAHHINYFWNEHVIHHSSEEFNLPCALRQSISSFFSISAFLLIPAALMGMPPKVIGTILPIHLFMQFWYHTRHIPKLGFLEYLIITPSQHRVHHAINTVYLDKNIGQIFPFWDRMFGTYQEELEEEPCVYGTKKIATTWNPVIINFQHLWMLMQDAWHAGRWIDKLTVWIKPTGWRPADVAERFPVPVVEEASDQVKYDTLASRWLHAWSWTQMLMTNLFLMYMLINFDRLIFQELLLYGLFLFAHIYAYTTLMDLNQSAVIFEVIKCFGGLYLVINSGDWFGLDSYWVLGSTAVSVYLVLSLLIVAVFTQWELRKE